MPDFPENKFVLFSNLNKSKQEDSKEDYWAKAEWSLDEIHKLHEWAWNEASRVQNQRGEECVEVSMKLLPRKSKAGNDYYLGVVSDPRPRPAQDDDAI